MDNKFRVLNSSFDDCCGLSTKEKAIEEAMLMTNENCQVYYVVEIVGVSKPQSAKYEDVQ